MEPEEQALLDELLAHEDELQFSTFTNDTAWTVGTALVDAAWRAGAAVTVDIRRGDWVIFHHAMEGTTPDNTVWIERKIRTVQRFRHSSFYLGTYYRLHHGGFESKTGLSLQEYAAHGGCRRRKITRWWSTCYAPTCSRNADQSGSTTPRWPVMRPYTSGRR
jgi:uncharacterized protein (UPF0303 family)